MRIKKKLWWVNLYTLIFYFADYVALHSGIGLLQSLL